jgi:hypothetical protein
MLHESSLWSARVTLWSRANRLIACGALAVLALYAGGCGVTSVVNEKDAAALPELAQWKSGADAELSGLPEARKQAYRTAMTAVNGWIDAKKDEATRVGGASVGTVDLSKTSLNPIRPQVEQFGPGGRTTASDVANTIKELVAAERKKSAELLDAQLEKYKWTKLP